MDATNTSDFVGRQQEIALIREAIEATDASTHLFLISGPSGIGKTRLLREIPTLFAHQEIATIVSRIDCYRTSTHIPFGVEIRLASELGAFESFHRSFRDWYRLKLFETQSPAPGASEAVSDAFLRHYNEYSQKQRIVLCFDTVEVAKRSTLWNRIIKLVFSLKNTVVLLAGQGIDSEQKILEKYYADLAKTICEVDERDDQKHHQTLQITTFRLSGLNLEETSLFIQNRAGELALDATMKQNIHLLTKGVPALVTLTIAWLNRSVPLRQIEKLRQKNLDGFSSENLKQYQTDVEKMLVRPILELTDHVDQAILQMAWIHRRFDINILSILLGIPIDECRHILTELESLPFTRILPGGVCVLHDRIRELVNEHDWPIADPHGTYRLELDNKMVRYYEELIQDQIKVVKQVRKKVSDPDFHEFDEHQKREIFDEFIKADTQRWIYEAEAIFYAFRADPEQGARRFIRAFDEATDSSRDMRELLVSEVESLIENPNISLSPKNDYSIRIRIAKNDADAGDTDIAYRKFVELQTHKGVEEAKEYTIDLLIQLGNAAVRLGEIDEATGYFHEALEESLILDTSDKLLWIARSEHAFAWLCRQQGNLSEASKHYHSGLERISSNKDDKKWLRIQAWLKNGLGYVEHLQGHNRKAETNCLEALKIWGKLNVPMQLGSIYSTLGEIMTGQDRNDEALNYYIKALYIFEEHNAWEWQVLVYHEMAYSRWCVEDYDNAWRFIRKSQIIAEEHNITREFPSIFHRLGLLVLENFGIPQAIPHFEHGVVESQDHENGQMLLENLVELVQLYSYLYNTEKMNEYAEKMYGNIHKQQLHYPLLEGRLEIILAESALEQTPPDYDNALASYKKAIPLVAQHGGYARYRLSSILASLAGRIAELPPLLAVFWCKTMQETWQQLEVSSVRPEILDFCKRELEVVQAGQT